MIKKKKVLLTIVLLFISFIGMGCPVCERNQPKILQGITHGSGPQSQWDYLIIGVTTLIVLFTLFYSLKYLIKPGEKSSDHIKRTILFNE